MSFSQEVQLDLLQSDLANTLNVPEDNVVTTDLYNVCAGLIKEDRAEDADRILTAWHYDHKAVAELLAKTLPIEADSSKAQWHRELVNGMTIDVQKAIVCLQNYRHMDRIPSDFDMENISYAMNRVYNSMMLMQMERSWNRSNKTFEHQVLNKVVSAVEQHIYRDFAIEAADRLWDRRELVDGKWVLSGSPIDLSDPTQFDCEAIAPVRRTRFGKSQPDHGNGNADLPGVFFTVDRQTNTVTNINVIVFDHETDMHYDVPLPPFQTARILEELGTTHGFVWTVAEEERYKKQSVSERLSDKVVYGAKVFSYDVRSYYDREERQEKSQGWHDWLEATCREAYEKLDAGTDASAYRSFVENVSRRLDGMTFFNTNIQPEALQDAAETVFREEQDGPGTGDGREENEYDGEDIGDGD
jgi:hypothetical protein